MLTGEVAPSIRKWLERLLVAAELHILADLPVRIGPQQVWVGERYVQRGSSVPVGADARIDRFDLPEERRGVADGIGLGWLALEGGQRHPATGVVDEARPAPCACARTINRGDRGLPRRADSRCGRQPPARTSIKEAWPSPYRSTTACARR